jgi:hypothetical protein
MNHIVYRGTPIQNPLIEKGRYVSSMLERAATYSRYPNNGRGTKIGYIYELEVDENDVDLNAAREDCLQGKLRKTVLARRMAVCDLRLDLEKRQSPVKIKFDGMTIWANGKNIDWVSIRS